MNTVIPFDADCFANGSADREPTPDPCRAVISDGDAVQLRGVLALPVDSDAWKSDKIAFKLPEGCPTPRGELYLTCAATAATPEGADGLYFDVRVDIYPDGTGWVYSKYQAPRESFVPATDVSVWLDGAHWLVETPAS